MLLSSLNTGSTDLRDTEVQQPNTAATLSLLINSRAFSANSGQFEAGSTTTASSFLPSRPPFLFCSSMSISMTSFKVVSLMAIVPESECRMPTLMVSWAFAGSAVARPMASPAAAASQRDCGRAATAGNELSISESSVCALFRRAKRRRERCRAVRIERRGQGACQGFRGIFD
jgi:hypothetical protein